MITQAEFDNDVVEEEESNPKNDFCWSEAFGVDELEDFQTQSKLKEGAGPASLPQQAAKLA